MAAVALVAACRTDLHTDTTPRIRTPDAAVPEFRGAAVGDDAGCRGADECCTDLARRSRELIESADRSCAADDDCIWLCPRFGGLLALADGPVARDIREIEWEAFDCGGERCGAECPAEPIAGCVDGRCEITDDCSCADVPLPEQFGQECARAADCPAPMRCLPGGGFGARSCGIPCATVADCPCAGPPGANAVDCWGECSYAHVDSF